MGTTATRHRARVGHGECAALASLSGTVTDHDTRSGPARGSTSLRLRFTPGHSEPPARGKDSETPLRSGSPGGVRVVMSPSSGAWQGTTATRDRVGQGECAALASGTDLAAGGFSGTTGLLTRIHATRRL